MQSDAAPPPANAGFFADHTVAGLGAQLRDGRTSPEQLVDHALQAVARLDPRLNAFVTIDEAGARAGAVRAARELAGGTDLGPLHGIPVAVKDVIDTAGLRTTVGSRHFTDRVPERDAECVRRLRAAGAIIVGKTTTHELAYGPTGDRSANGAAHNPYRPGHIAGGSSCGSAVAVAAGIVPLSLGTDTGGSVRIPAACCGVVGLRPTHGAIPLDGVFPLAPSLDTVGPLARTVADCRLLWQVLVGGDSTPGHRPPRIGWVRPDAVPAIAPAVADAARALAERLSAAGLPEVPVPDVGELRQMYRVIQSREAYRVHAGRLASAPELFDDEVLARLRSAAQVGEAEYQRARELRGQARRAITELFGDHDLLASPTIPITAPPLYARSQLLGGVEIDIRAALLSMTTPWSVLGLPALSIPAGVVDGLPVGLQLVARPGAEHLLLSI